MGGWLKCLARSLMLTMRARFPVLVFGLVLSHSSPVRSHAGRLRQNWGHRWQPPQQIQQLTGVAELQYESMMDNKVNFYEMP